MAGYELSSRQAGAKRAGTPERPLSDLGLRGYLAHWTSVLVRYFRLIFFTRQDPRLASPSQIVDDARTRNKAREARKKAKEALSATLAENGKLQAKAIASTADSKADNTGVQERAGMGISFQRAEGGENLDEASIMQEEGKEGEEGYEGEEPFGMRFSLAEIARATFLREDDVAFTLIHSGLAQYRALQSGKGAEQGDSKDREIASNGAIVIKEEEMELVIAPGLVEEVATRFKVKPRQIMEHQYCLV